VNLCGGSLAPTGDQRRRFLVEKRTLAGMVSRKAERGGISVENWRRESTATNSADEGGRRPDVNSAGSAPRRPVVELFFDTSGLVMTGHGRDPAIRREHADCKSHVKALEWK